MSGRWFSLFVDVQNPTYLFRWGFWFWCPILRLLHYQTTRQSLRRTLLWFRIRAASQTCRYFRVAPQMLRNGFRHLRRTHYCSAWQTCKSRHRTMFERRKGTTVLEKAPLAPYLRKFGAYTHYCRFWCREILLRFRRRHCRNPNRQMARYASR